MEITRDYICSLYQAPFLDLIFQAAQVHRQNHKPNEIQLCTLYSIKTGGCPENCHYCPQSAHYDTKLERKGLASVDEVTKQALDAKVKGATRFCMGAAWREVKDNQEFDQVLDMVKSVSKLNMEVCCTLGMLSESQAHKLKQAGLTAYNHNLDTSEEHYKEIIQTRTYQDRLQTIAHVSNAGISVCCGGIIGVGETADDRIDFLHTLSQLNPQPESVPINKLVRVEGTPLKENEDVDVFEWIRTIAIARIILPKSKVRLSAGRLELTREAQALAFMAGANSLFMGDKLLTTANPEADFDHQLLKTLGLKGVRSESVQTPRINNLEQSLN